MMRSFAAHAVEHRLARGHRQAVDRQAQALDGAVSGGDGFRIGCAPPQALFACGRVRGQA